jgi:hypothetical protein
MKPIHWLILFLPSVVWGASDQCDTAFVLTQIRPGAEWVMHGDSVKGLKWLDTKQKKPTAVEVEKAKKTCMADMETRKTRKAQARLDVKNPTTPTDKKVEQLILLLDLDR